MKRLVACAAFTLASTAWAGSVAGSKHDFSVRGPGPYRAQSEPSVCIFCHVSHRSGPNVLSSRPETSAQHRPYESTTMTSKVGQPTGSSRLCLSCHDGTIAVGQLRDRRIAMVGGTKPIDPGRRSNLGTDLRRSHPVSMRPTGNVPAPRGFDEVHLDQTSQVQCTSCHDPHEEWRDPEIGMFLVKRSARSALCLSCHQNPAAAASATHLATEARSTDPVTGATRTIADIGCSTCHTSHAADARGRLLRTGLRDDDICLGCHGKSTQKLISSDLGKPWSHTAPQSTRHDAAERPNAPDARALPERSPGAQRHVNCVDCHDPHVSTTRPGTDASLPGALAGVWGIDLDGQPVDPARHEYEICFKCHGDSANKPQARLGGSGTGARRAEKEYDLRLVFAPTAASSHPVAAPGKSGAVPSLRPPWSAGSVIRCTDCHASDSGPGAGGFGASGPHGSTYPTLLERRYLTTDGTPESAASYALCYKCHDRDVLLSARSSFPLHRQHVVATSAPCSVCHDAHGIASTSGNPLNNAHLLSFDLTVVRGGQAGPARYDSSGTGHGSCALTCHGTEHRPGARAFSY